MPPQCSAVPRFKPGPRRITGVRSSLAVSMQGPLDTTIATVRAFPTCRASVSGRSANQIHWVPETSYNRGRRPSHDQLPGRVSSQPMFGPQARPLMVPGRGPFCCIRTVRHCRNIAGSQDRWLFPIVLQGSSCSLRRSARSAWPVPVSASTSIRWQNGVRRMAPVSACRSMVDRCLGPR